MLTAPLIDLAYELELIKPLPKKKRKSDPDPEPKPAGYFSKYNPDKPCDTVKVAYGGALYTCTFIDTEAKFKGFLSKFQTLEKQRASFDTETRGLYGDITGLSFAFDRSHGYYIPTGHDFGVQLDRTYVMESLRPYFEDPEFTWICHNAAYEMIVLEKHHEIRLGKYHDTMLLGKELNGNLPMGLKDRSQIELGLSDTQDFKDIVPKNTTVNQHPIPKVGIYAAQDAVFTFALLEEFAKDPNLKYIKKAYADCEIPVVRYFAEMTRVGIEVDASIINEIKEDYIKEVETVEKQIYYEASYNPETGKYDAYIDENGEYQNLLYFNIGSPKDKAKIVFERLKWPVVHRSKTTNAPSLDGKKALPKYIDMGFKLAELLSYWSKLKKIISSYTDGITMNLDKDNRVHPSYKQWGTTTGRASCSNPNFQSMPTKAVKKGGRNIREAFIARKGYSLLVCDFSQLEMRVLAHFSKDPNMEKIFTSDIDMHSYNAAIIEGVFYNKPTTYEEFVAGLAEEKALMDKGLLKKEDAYYHKKRDKSKTVGFGLNYGAGVREDLGITEEFIDAYYSAIPYVKPYKEACRIFLERYGYMFKLLGGRRYLPDVWSNNRKDKEKAHRQGFSTHVQGSAGDLMKLSMIKIGQYRDKEKIPAYMVAQVHDELIMEVRNDWLEHMMEKVQYFMENCYPLRVPLEAEPGSGKSWYEAK